jgi:hypothetical protein
MFPASRALDGLERIGKSSQFRLFRGEQKLENERLRAQIREVAGEI